MACRLLPPACLPEELVPHACSTAFEVTFGSEWILKGAVRSGVDLTVPRLRQICLSLEVKLPKPKEGSGKNGAMKKEDYVRSLIGHLWPQGSEEFYKEVFAKMMKLNKEKVDLNVLAMVSELDTDNQESFKKLKEHAMLELEAKVFGKGKLSTLESNHKGGQGKKRESPKTWRGQSKKDCERGRGENERRKHETVGFDPA